MAVLKPTLLFAFLGLFLALSYAAPTNQTENGIIEDVTCWGCKVVVRGVRKILGGEKTEKKIIHALDSVCDHMWFFKYACRSFVDGAVDNVLKYFMTEISEADMCEALDVCPPNCPVIDLVFNKCDVCDSFESDHGRRMQNFTTTHYHISKNARRTCRTMPKQQQAACHSLHTEYHEALHEFVKTSEGTKGFCKAINICNQ